MAHVEAHLKGLCERERVFLCLHFKDHYPCLLQKPSRLVVTQQPGSQKVGITALQQSSGNTEYLQVLAFTYGMLPSPYVCTIGFQHVKHLKCLNETIGSRSWKPKYKQLFFCRPVYMYMCLFCLLLKIQVYFPGSGQQNLHWDCLSGLLSPVSGPFKTKQSSFGHLNCIWISLFKSPPCIWEVIYMKLIWEH